MGEYNCHVLSQDYKGTEMPKIKNEILTFELPLRFYWGSGQYFIELSFNFRGEGQFSSQTVSYRINVHLIL